MDKASIIKTTQKFLAKGQIDKAIAEWQKLAKAYPDGNTLNFLGDLFVKKGDKAAAVQEYNKAAKVFTNEGFSLKAVAIHKKVLNINPHFAPALIALGKLNEEKNIATDAIKYYLAAADVLAKENKRNELLNVFARITNLAPTNVQLRIKIAELFSKEGFVPEAAKEYYSVGQLYSNRGDINKAMEYYLKANEIQPNNADVLVALSRLAEEGGDFGAAISYLDTAMDRIGENPTLLLRGSELAIRQGDTDRAAELIAKVVEVEPDNLDARKQLGALYGKQGDTDKAWAEYKTIVDKMSSENPTEAITILNKFKDAEPIENRKKLAFLYRQQDKIDEATMELAGLADLYEGQNRTEEALSTWREAYDLSPDDLEIASRINRLEQKVSGPTQEAVPEAPEPSPVMPESDETPAGTSESGIRLAGQHVAEEAMEEVLTAGATGETMEGPAVEGGEKPLDVALTEADVFLKYGLHPDARSLLEGLKVGNPDSIPLHEKLKTVYREMNETDLAVTECIVLGSLYERKGNAAKAQSLYEEAYELDPEDPRLEGKVGGTAAASPEGQAPSSTAGMQLPITQNEEFSEAEFYFQQGFYKEAGDIYHKLLADYPTSDELIEKIALVESKLSVADAGLEAPVEEEAEMSSPLDEIEIPEFEAIDMQDAEEPALDDNVLEIFDEFKKGLEKEIADEDAETHYNLGIAYMEMGLIDDSIKAFQTAQHDPSYHSQSSTMLGICYMQKGLHNLAVDAFSAALMKTDKSNETYWSLKYDLAHAHEKNGDVKQALDLFTEVYGWNADFRDVSERLNELKKKADAGPQKAGQPQSGDAAKKDRRSRVSYI